MMFRSISRGLGMLAVSAAMTFGAAMPVAFAATEDPAASRKFLDDAKKYIERGDLKAAVIQLKNALQQDPNNAEARVELGKLYLKAQQGAAAEKELRAAQQRGVISKGLLVDIARAQLLQRKYDLVLKSLKDDVTDAKLRSDVLTVRAKAFLGVGSVDEALKSLEEAEKLSPENSDMLVTYTRALISKKKLEEAAAKINKAVQVVPNDSTAHALKGELTRLRNDQEGAIRSFDKAISLDKNNLAARLGRAAVLIDQDKGADAELDIKAVLQVIPRHPLANYLSAVVSARKKDFRAAQESLQATGDALDSHMPAVFLKGAVAYGLNQNEQAVSHLSRYVEAVPSNTQARKLYGATLVRNNEHKKAIEVLEPLLKGKDDPQVYSLLGTAYMRSGQYQKSSELFEKAAVAAPDASAIRTQLALSRLASGGTDKAVGDLRAAIDIDPDGRQAPILLALVHLRKGEFDAALKVTERLKKTMPDNPLAQNLIGAAQLGKGLKNEARASFKKALEIKSDFFPARMNLAQLDLQEEKIDSAVKQYEAIIKENPKHVGAMLAMANIAADQKRTNDVVAWLRKAADAAPTSLVPNLRLVQFYRQNGEPRKALSTVRALSQKKPDDPQVLELLGRAELDARQPEAAILTFRRLTDIEPKNPRSHQLLGAVLLATGDVHGARASFNQALAIDGNFAPALSALVGLESTEKNYEEAIALTEKLRAIQPKSPAADTLAGDVYVAQRNYPKALEAYRAAAKLEDTANIAIRIFNAERVNGEDRGAATDKALANLQKWVDEKKSQQARRILASSYLAVKRYDDAIREWETLLKENPDSPVALNNLAWLYDTKGDLRAVQYAERAYKAAPKSAAIMDTLGWILSRRGDHDRALELLGKAHTAAPASGDIAYHYSVTLKNAGKSDEAKRTLQRFFVKNPEMRFPKEDEAKKFLKELGG